MGPRRAEANLAALIESTEDLIWSVDLDYRVLTFNRAFHDDIQQDYGVRPAVGMRAEDLMPRARAALWPPLFDRALSEGPFRVEYSLVDGRILELAFNRIVQDGETTGISVFGKDTQFGGRLIAVEFAERMDGRSTTKASSKTLPSGKKRRRGYRLNARDSRESSKTPRPGTTESEWTAAMKT